jgi:hypothetical protein
MFPSAFEQESMGHTHQERHRLRSRRTVAASAGLPQQVIDRVRRAFLSRIDDLFNGPASGRRTRQPLPNTHQVINFRVV